MEARAVAEARVSQEVYVTVGVTVRVWVVLGLSSDPHVTCGSQPVI